MLNLDWDVCDNWYCTCIDSYRHTQLYHQWIFSQEISTTHFENNLWFHISHIYQINIDFYWANTYLLIIKKLEGSGERGSGRVEMAVKLVQQWNKKNKNDQYWCQRHFEPYKRKATQQWLEGFFETFPHYPPVIASLGDELLELSQSDAFPRYCDTIRNRLTAEIVPNNRDVGGLLHLLFPGDKETALVRWQNDKKLFANAAYK